MSDDNGTPTIPASTEDVRQQNEDRLAALTAQGVSLNVLGYYMAALTEAVLPAGTLERLDFVAKWERQLSGLITDAEVELRKALLTLNNPMPAVPLSRAARRAQARQ